MKPRTSSLGSVTASHRAPKARLGRPALALGVALAAATFAIAVSDAQAASRPDLVVSKGTVRTSSSVVTGSFVVRNRGRVRAGRSTASLVVYVAGVRRELRRYAVGALRRSRSRVVRVSLAVPAGLPAGRHRLVACANSSRRLRERSTRNNCRTVGTLVVAAPAPPPSAPQPPPPASVSTVPAKPLAFAENDVFTIGTAPSNYWIYVPGPYDETHRTPITLFVWLHGCGGYSEGDIWNVAPGATGSYIAIAPGGREGACWNVNADSALVLAAIADVKTHFNINPRRVVLGGYSSGGDLAYRTAFYNSTKFAGVLAEDTAPFRDTGSSPAASLAAATWKFHVVHLAHAGDVVYPLAQVAAETDAMQAAGFPVELIVRAGNHWDPDTATSGTDYDLRTFLLPRLNDNWLAPG